MEKTEKEGKNFAMVNIIGNCLLYYFFTLETEKKLLPAEQDF